MSLRESVLKAIADEIRIKILEGLDGVDNRTFVEIKDMFNLYDATLSRHLKKLTSAMLVSHAYERNKHQENPRFYSHYQITELGEYILKIMRNALGEDEINRLV